MLNEDPSFKDLTKKERRLLNLDPGPSKFRSSTEQMAAEMTKGMDKRKLERELKKLEAAEWE